MILSRPHGGGNVPRKQLEYRIVAFQGGQVDGVERVPLQRRQLTHIPSVGGVVKMNDDEARQAWKEQLWFPAQCPPLEH